MEERLIIDVLKKWNIWEKPINTGIKRPKYIEHIYPYLERKEILVLKGIRRSGKSTLLKQLMLELIASGVDKMHLLYLNLEDYNFTNDLTVTLFDAVLTAYRNYAHHEGRIFFFIDEIQTIPGWEKWIRTKYDLQEPIKFIVTGSSASLLSREFSTLLTGRNISFTIHALSFQEFLMFSKTHSLEEYLLYGGFPEVVLEPVQEKKMVLLEQYFEDIIHKDIISRYAIRNTKQLIDIARYIISTAGSKVSFNKLSKVFGISKDTIAQYIAYMVDAFLLFEVTYFSYSTKIRHDVTKLPKFYASDNGLINAVHISQNQGQLFENAVAIKLSAQSDDIHYWSALTSEVDFIVDRVAINVTATNTPHEREQNGLEEFRKKHRNVTTLIITKSVTNGNMLALADFLAS